MWSSRRIDNRLFVASYVDVDVDTGAWDSSLRDLFASAALEALGNAGADHLDAIFVGNMSGGRFVGQEHLGPLMADQIGMAGVPAARVESACASGGLALRTAFVEVPVVRLEISSVSHPFWTGKMRELDSDGKIDRFRKRYGAGKK